MARKRKSGNGTNQKQWIYFLINIPLVFVVKIGITGSLKDRIRSIDKDNFGWDWHVFLPMPVFGAYSIEQLVKRIANWFCPEWFRHLIRFFFRGTGKTERYFILMLIPGVFLAILVFIAEWVFYIGFFYFIVYTFKNWPV